MDVSLRTRYIVRITNNDQSYFTITKLAREKKK